MTTHSLISPIDGFIYRFAPFIFLAQVSAAATAAVVRLGARAANGCCKAAGQMAYRHAARIDRDFAKRCTARLRALRGAAPSVWRRALRELARERAAMEDAREALCDSPWAAARRDRARERRDEAWRAWFTALERAVAGCGTPPRELIAGNPVRNGAPIRRLCERSSSPPPAPEALLAQYDKAKGRGPVEEKLRLGSMMLDIEAAVDSSLVRDPSGEIVGRNAGIRGWIAENCPSLLSHYASLMGYRRLADEFRKAHGLRDPHPAARFLEPEFPAERFAPALREPMRHRHVAARKLLSSPAAKTAKGFAEALARTRRTGIAPRRRTG